MVVVLPTYIGHIVPLPGLAGHLGRLPGVGRALKTALGYRMLRGLPLLAQPNRRTGRMIVPELVGDDERRSADGGEAVLDCRHVGGECGAHLNL